MRISALSITAIFIAGFLIGQFSARDDAKRFGILTKFAEQALDTLLIIHSEEFTPEEESSESLEDVLETLLCFYHTLREDLGGAEGELGQKISTLEINLAEMLSGETGADYTEMVRELFSNSNSDFFDGEVIPIETSFDDATRQKKGKYNRDGRPAP